MRSRARRRASTGCAGFRIGHAGQRLADEFLQVLAAADIEDAAAIAVAVDVEHGLFLQFGGMGLGPFGRAQQHRLFRVPAGVDDGALGLPAGLAPVAPIALASASMAIWPDSGSLAPNTQPS